jgi:beta-glucanase (GH16 family)
VPPSVPTPRRNRNPSPSTGRRTGAVLALACVAALTAASAVPATAAVRTNPTTTENWATTSSNATTTSGAASSSTPSTPTKPTASGTTASSPAFHANTPETQLIIVPSSDALDGSALKLRMDAYPDAGPRGGAVISSNRLFRYGRFATRMRTADCTGLDHPGVVTGAFTYGSDTSDANHNGITDNSELDVEVLCAQPDVVYLSIWTDYSETGNRLAEITRAINLRTGVVLSNCYITSYGSGCQPALAGENSPATLPARPGFNSATQFHTYTIDWQPDHVTFSLDADTGTGTGTGTKTSELWNYRGPRSRIPSNPSWFMQNVSYTKVWDPLNGAAHNQPTQAVSALIDSTSTPR